MADEEQIEALIKKMAATAAEWTDEEFAGKIVGLLILDKGVVNAWQRTIELAIKIAREREKLRPED